MHPVKVFTVEMVLLSCNVMVLESEEVKCRGPKKRLRTYDYESRRGRAVAFRFEGGVRSCDTLSESDENCCIKRQRLEGETSPRNVEGSNLEQLSSCYGVIKNDMNERFLKR